MRDFFGQELNIGDQVIYANDGRLWKGKLCSVSGPLCNTCQVTVPELNGRVVTLKLKNSRVPSHIKLSERKLIKSGELEITIRRLIKLDDSGGD